MMRIRVQCKGENPRVVKVEGVRDININGVPVRVAAHRGIADMEDGYVVTEWQSGLKLYPRTGVTVPAETAAAALVGVGLLIKEVVGLQGADTILSKIQTVQFDSFLNGPEGYVDDPSEL